MNLNALVRNQPTNFIDCLGLFLRGYFSDKIVAKSFINGPGPLGKLGYRFGSLPGIAGDPFLADARLAVFAATIGKLGAFDQKGADDSKDGSYRLYGEINLILCCSGASFKQISFNSTHDGGQEVGPISGTSNITANVKRISGSELEVEYAIWGRPNPLAEVGMQQVAIRTSTNIWQSGKIRYSCQNDQITHKITMFRGSAHPSRRLWINGTLAKDTPQRAPADLWMPLPGLPNFVHE